MVTEPARVRLRGPGRHLGTGHGGRVPDHRGADLQPDRGRGLGADDMLITSAGLWIASDNLNGTTQCGGVNQHAGICLLPYS